MTKKLVRCWQIPREAPANIEEIFTDCVEPQQIIAKLFSQGAQPILGMFLWEDVEDPNRDFSYLLLPDFEAHKNDYYSTPDSANLHEFVARMDPGQLIASSCMVNATLQQLDDRWWPQLTDQEVG